jgi:capsular polysaccharide export protein
MTLIGVGLWRVIQKECPRLLAPFNPDELPKAALTSESLANRRFLIVSAPFGRFSRVLAEVITDLGGDVSRMLFNAGDAVTWQRPKGIAFKEDSQAWHQKVPEFVQAYTDIIVFGEGGPYNQAILSQRDRISPRVWVLENGYFRPDWITLEQNGVNGSSGLPREAAGYPIPGPEMPVTQPVGKILPHHVINISLYHFYQMVGGLAFPKYRHPYTMSPLWQFWGHVRRYFTLACQPRSACEASVIRARGPFYIACLQREGDAQLLRYSKFADNTAFLAEVMTSFAAHAPKSSRLVVKNHPLDPGLNDLAHMTRCLAIERGLEGRVDFIDGGNLAQLCRAAEGMVVNNSSAALSALGFRTPVKVLGQAFFDFEGLTDQQGLDSFWSAPKASNPALFTAFRAHVISKSQINGNYHEPRSIRPTAQRIAAAFAAVRLG